MTLAPCTHTPLPPAGRRHATAAAACQRAGPSGQRLFDAAAGLLAASGAVAANADAPDSTTALGPTLACVEASLEALAEAAERIGDERSPHWTPQPITTRRFERLGAVLQSAAAACNDARRAAAGDA